jgi:hypothetical protein
MSRKDHGLPPPLGTKSLIVEAKAYSKIPSASCSIRFHCTSSHSLKSEADIMIQGERLLMFKYDKVN